MAEHARSVQHGVPAHDVTVPDTMSSALKRRREEAKLWRADEDEKRFIIMDSKFRQYNPLIVPILDVYKQHMPDMNRHLFEHVREPVRMRGELRQILDVQDIYEIPVPTLEPATDAEYRRHVAGQSQEGKIGNLTWKVIKAITYTRQIARMHKGPIGIRQGFLDSTGVEVEALFDVGIRIYVRYPDIDTLGITFPRTEKHGFLPDRNKIEKLAEDLRAETGLPLKFE